MSACFHNIDLHRQRRHQHHHRLVLFFFSFFPEVALPLPHALLKRDVELQLSNTCSYARSRSATIVDAEGSTVIEYGSTVGLHFHESCAS